LEEAESNAAAERAAVLEEAQRQLEDRLEEARAQEQQALAAAKEEATQEAQLAAEAQAEEQRMAAEAEAAAVRDQAALKAQEVYENKLACAQKEFENQLARVQVKRKWRGGGGVMVITSSNALLQPSPTAAQLKHILFDRSCYQLGSTWMTSSRDQNPTLSTNQSIS
jgi:hypothetical protein